MADKYTKVCDRCGKEVYPSRVGVLTGEAFTKFAIRKVVRGHWNACHFFTGEYELCPECYKSFEDWLSKETEVNQ